MSGKYILQHPEYFDPAPENVSSKSIVRRRLRYSNLFPHIYGSLRDFNLMNVTISETECKEFFACSFDMDLPAREAPCDACIEQSDCACTFHCLYSDITGKLVLKCIKHPFTKCFTIEASPLPRILEKETSNVSIIKSPKIIETNNGIEENQTEDSSNLVHQTTPQFDYTFF